jgi:asparagine synthase (glutamine-hydrolysing)
MSGIVGILYFDDAPADPCWLQQMTELVSYRGPDARNIWTGGAVGFGHAMLRTTPESQRERQPDSLDGQVWITADARLDARAELIQKLKSKGRDASPAATDPVLLLHAYHAWGEDCVHHLLGDFAFAIWDSRRQRLFCVRDHFGVKPFYYAPLKDCLLFSNTLNCLRGYPAICDELNELAVGDFLLFGCNLDPATTMFADILRLPPGHCFTCSERTFRLRRYWALPTDGPIRYKQPSDYVDQFLELLWAAVEDRLRTDRGGVYMSGGLDSTAVAAVARDLLSKRSAHFDLRAHTVVYDRLIPDEERHYSGVVAKALGIPIHYLVADNYRLFERWDQPEMRLPEPVDDPQFIGLFDQYRQVAAHSRVVLDGQGGDELLRYEFRPYLREMLKRGRFLRLVTDLAQYARLRHRVSPVGFGARFLPWLRKPRPQPTFPPWLNAEFAARLNLWARWKQHYEGSAPIHPIRPQAYAALVQPVWASILENSDPGVTRCPVEARHPFLDLRLVNFLLAIPPMPWCVDKELLRVAMANILPEAVRLRRKMPLAGEPLVELLRKPEAQWVDFFEPLSALAKYVDRAAIPRLAGETDGDQARLLIRPLSLNFWLQSWVDFKYKTVREAAYEGKG